MNRKDYDLPSAIAEEIVMQWLTLRAGFICAPICKIDEEEDRGPRLSLPNEHMLPSPDGLCMKPIAETISVPQSTPGFFKEIDLFFEDTKLKTKLSYYRKNRRWQTGIDKRCWHHYSELKRITDIEVLVFHLVMPTSLEDAKSQGAPMEYMPAPSGLFVHSISQPYSDDFRGMVYWGIEDLPKLATLSDFPSALMDQLRKLLGEAA